MSDKNKIALIGSVTFAFGLFGKEPDKLQIDYYVNKLLPYGVKESILAIDKACEECKFMPTIAELLSNLKPSKGGLSLRAQEQWNEFYVALVSVPQPVFSDPITAYIAENLVSIWVLKKGEESDVKYAQKKFVDAYANCLNDVDEIKAKCLRGEVKILSNLGMENLEQEENLKLALSGEKNELGQPKADMSKVNLCSLCSIDDRTCKAEGFTVWPVTGNIKTCPSFSGNAQIGEKV